MFVDYQVEKESAMSSINWFEVDDIVGVVRSWTFEMIGISTVSVFFLNLV